MCKSVFSKKLEIESNVTIYFGLGYFTSDPLLPTGPSFPG